MARSTWLIGPLFASGLTLGVACTGPYSADTEGTDGETTGSCPVGSLGCPCTSGGSCDPGLACGATGCVKLDEETTTSATSTGVDPTSTSSSDTTAGPECDPDGVGGVDPACPDGRRYCLQGICVDCGGIDCAQLSPSLPKCDLATGACAACVCDDATPVCDPTAHTCSKCDAHDQCPASACDLWSGACMPADATLWVGGGGCDDAGVGSEASPLCTLSEAFARVSDGPDASVAVRVQPGDYDVANPLRAPKDRLVALVHATGGDDDPAVRILAAASPAISIDPQGRLLLDAIQLVQGGSDSLSCKQGEAWLDRLVIAGSVARGMTAESCTLKLRRGVLTGNKTTAGQFMGGAVHFENSFITSNGNMQNGAGGIYLGAGARLEAVYTTWVDNQAAAGTQYSVACDEDADTETVEVRNSVAINKGFNTLCDGASVATTAWSTEAPTGSNIAVGFADLGAYLAADVSLMGVYRAIPGSALNDLAMWEDGDPAIDFDGDARPSGNNSPDFAGADRATQ